jgi:hypothetical protein
MLSASSRFLFLVMAGLDPAIQGKRRALALDPRIKSGGEGKGKGSSGAN